jgi:hypothetical protein
MGRKCTYLLVLFALLLSFSAYAATSQTVDGRVYYDYGNGSLVEVGGGFPVLWYYEAHDVYSYTTTGPIYAYKWNSTSYFNFGQFQGNNSQWQTLRSCNATDYGLFRYRLNASQRCLAATIPRCHDIVINMSVLGEPILDSDSDGICKYYDNCADDYNPTQADYNSNGEGDACDPYTCFGIAFSDPNVCSEKGDCIALDECECDNGYSGEICDIRDIWTCFGISKDDPVVCSEKGSCIALDECECDNGYTGENCEIEPVIEEICNGIDDDGDGVLDGDEGFPPVTCGEENCSGIKFCEDTGYGNCTSQNQACGALRCEYLNNACEEYSDILYTCSEDGICLDEEYIGTTCEDTIIYEPACLPECNIADVDGDGAVNVIDYHELTSTFGMPNYCGPVDFNLDGTVNLQDFVIMRVNYGNTTGPCIKEEPICFAIAVETPTNNSNISTFDINKSTAEANISSQENITKKDNENISNSNISAAPLPINDTIGVLVVHLPCFNDCSDPECYQQVCSEPGVEPERTCEQINSTSVDCVSTTNHPPEIFLEYSARYNVSSDQDFKCMATIVDDNSWDLEFFVKVNISGGTGTGDLSGMKRCEKGVLASACYLNVTIPSTYTRAGDTIICSMKPMDRETIGEKKNISIPVVGYGPIDLKVNLTPDYFEKYDSKDNVNYTNIYPTNVTCSVRAIDYNPMYQGPGKLKVTATFEIESDGAEIMANESRIKSIDKVEQCTSGKVCDIILPWESVYPGDNITCNVTVANPFGVKANETSSTIRMPTLDVEVERMDVMDVVTNVSLINGKGHMVRVWVNFTSDLIDNLDENIQVGFIQSYESIDDEVNTKYVKYATIKNYPDLDVLKQNPGATIAPNVIASSLLREIKQGNDSVNFYNIAKITIPIEHSFVGFVGDSSVKESNVRNNKNVAAMEVRDVSEQIKGFKVGIFVVGKNTSMNASVRRDVLQNSQANYQHMLATYPFVQDKTTLMMDNITAIAVDYNETIMEEWWAKVYDDTGTVDEKNYIHRFGNRMDGRVSAAMRRQRVDFAIVFLLDDILMGNAVNMGYNTPGKYFAYFRNIPELANSVLSHEMGHAVANLSDGYFANKTNHLNSFIGLAGKEANYNYFANSGTGGLMINIWTETGPIGHHQALEDWPEHNKTLGDDAGNTYMGDRYFNIMSASQKDTVVNSANYTAIYNGLKTKGYFN